MGVQCEGVIEECKKELYDPSIKIFNDVCWRIGRPYWCHHSNELGIINRVEMKTGRGGSICSLVVMKIVEAIKMMWLQGRGNPWRFGCLLRTPIFATICGIPTQMSSCKARHYQPAQKSLLKSRSMSSIWRG